MSKSKVAKINTTSGLAYASQLVDLTDSGTYYESDSSSATPQIFVRRISKKDK